MAFEGQGKIALPAGDWRVVDITEEVIEVLQRSLSEARSVIEAGGTWSPLVHILHPEGMQSMRIKGMSADLREKDRVARLIIADMKELNAIVAIMITDNWVADETWGNSVHRSMQAPFPGRAQALVVAIWGPDGVATCGMQMYRRSANGKVEFEELKWQEPSTEIRSARGNIGQTNNVLAFIPAKDIVGDSGDQALSDDIARTYAVKSAMMKVDDILPGEIQRALQKMQRADQREATASASFYVIVVENATAMSASGPIRTALTAAGFKVERSINGLAKTQTLTVTLNGKTGQDVMNAIDNALDTYTVQTEDGEGARVIAK